MATTGRGALASHEPGAALRYAALQLRIVAFLLDIIVLTSIFMLFVAAAIAYLAMSETGDLTDPAALTLAAIALAYPMAFIPLYFAGLWAWRGQTVGMMAVHLKVVGAGGGRLTFRRALGRTLALALSLLPLGLGLASALFDRRNRALHDFLAGSVVLELP